MEYRKLGKCGLKVSEIGLGGNTFGGDLSEEKSISVIRQALELGVNYIDTANVYNDGRSEECIGKAVKGKRSEVIIATKFGGLMEKANDPNNRSTSRYNIIKAVNASLKRLCTDYIDIYLPHRYDSTTPIEETLRALDDLVHAGKIRYIGCSRFAAWQLSEANWTSKMNNLESFTAVMAEYNLIDRHIESELVPCCEAYGIGVLPFRPLAAGFLTGIYHRGQPRPPQPWFMPDNIISEANYDKLEKLEAFAANHGHTIAELAIAWLLAHPWVKSVITGAATPEQVTANVAATSWKLTAEEMNQL